MHVDERLGLGTVDVVWKDIEAWDGKKGELGWLNDSVGVIWWVAWLLIKKTFCLLAYNGVKCV